MTGYGFPHSAGNRGRSIGCHHPRLQQNPLAKRHRAIIVISAMAEKRPAIANIPDDLSIFVISRGD